MERETSTTEYDTPKGRITVTRTLLVFRELHSGTNQVFRKELESTQVIADGDWLTAAMAAELA